MKSKIALWVAAGHLRVCTYRFKEAKLITNQEDQRGS